MEQQSARLGRPRSERARAAVLHAADDLLVELGYAAMTVKGIADRAGVGRQTVYRWWSTKAEILLEASADDARQELAVEPASDPVDGLTQYLDALAVFLTRSHAGAAYRALTGEAQHDPAVAALLDGDDVIGDSARAVLGRILGEDADRGTLDQATALLIGPLFYWLFTDHDPALLDTRAMAETCHLQLVRAGEGDGAQARPAASQPL
ncbi:TetR/AcrR family transcriptional regulator [Streptomyces tsukubensis]|uniref:TetR family transcriptional regulator n=1 Tax=Streptomyces tsukubensis TaxID=83656 RepID=A0A1V3ZZZ7_9ACTN|nr:TetR/AcrR family transcriptional regulator [Streptomyces tsukubensis]OON72104.1 TetR family transcriptional regulator [Streptomyces tsukubensis]QFR93912.1 TetR family transcriptional regulator [Streptomyces tsukubensis]